MLILARKINESINIGDKIEVSIIDIRGDQVKVGIKAPKEVKVFRREVYEAIQSENLIASRTSKDLPLLDNLLKDKKKP